MNFSEIVNDFDNLYRAFKKSKCGRSYKQSSMYFEFNAVDELRKIQKELIDKTYRVSKYTEFEVTRPKKRKIQACTFRDKVVQHILCDNVMRDKLPKICIEDSYSGQVGKGTLFAHEHVLNHIREFSEKYGTDGWFYKGDISKFYYNIRHRQAKDIMEYHFPADTHWLIERFVDSTDGDGVPLGNQINTYVSALYLDGFDRFITGELGIIHYGRYADDFFLIHPSKEYLAYAVSCMKEFLKTLGLALNPKSQLIPCKNGLAFCGFHYYPDGTVKMSNAKRREYRRKFNRMYRKCRGGTLPRSALAESVTAHLEHAKKATQYDEKYYLTRLEELKC